MDYRFINAGLAVLRAIVAGVCLLHGVTGNLVAGVYGVIELMAAVLMIGNCCNATKGDMTWRGLAVVACYFAGVIVVPVGDYSPAWLVGALLAWAGFRVWGMLEMRSSYSTLPTWVGLVESGPFVYVRYPLALAAIGARLCVMLAMPTPINLASGLVFMWACVLSVQLEESWLAEGRVWREYAERVRWRLVPGVY